jgi:DNA-binding response OmpR family regulator
MSNILIVEDEQHLADGLRFNLEAEGYVVEVVDNGEAALQLLASNPARFDAVVLDVMLPGIDGFQVVKELRRSGQFIPVLMLTARDRPTAWPAAPQGMAASAHGRYLSVCGQDH